MPRNDLEALARRLVRERIRGFRKGSTDESLHLHSFRVAGILKRHGYPAEVVLAGVLHDIVEDGETTLEELRRRGFSKRTVRLVDLASHDGEDGDKDRRWARMTERLRRAGDRDAWALKICDLIDNLQGSARLPDRDRRDFFLQVKAPVFLRLTRPMFRNTALYGELLDVFTRQGYAVYREILRRTV